MSSPRSEGPVYISSITVNVREELGRPVDHIILQTETGTFKKELPIQVSPGHEHKEVFDPAIELSARDRLSVSMQYPARWKGTRTPSITMELSEVVSEAQDDGHGNQISLFKLHKNIEVAMSVFHYSSPRFRILIIGNSGVGKSTLVQNVFGVKDMDVSEASRGRADMHREYISAENELFVLHDSVGLEAAEGDNFKRVKDFIDGRRKQKDLKDRLHAVWVCLAIPYAKGRLLEAGMEEFLRNRKEILGNIPIVVVLTKLDLLDNTLIVDLRKEGVTFKNIKEARPFLEPRRTTFIKEYCMQPLLRAAKGDIPRVAVSTKSGYMLESTISELAKTTISEIERSYADATERPSIERDALLNTVRMAMRPSGIEMKVDFTITLGKKRYWRNLDASFNFSADGVKEYLLVLHQDIIQVWNFTDPEMVLQGDSFKAALLDTSNLGVQDIRAGQAVPDPVMPLVSSLSPLVDDLVGVINALPVAEATTVAKLCHEVSKSPQTIVKCIIAYFVDLTYVMEILFILALQESITSRDVALALEVYKRSTYRNRVHLELHDVSASFVMLPEGRNVVLEKIETLIRQSNITDYDVSRLRAQIRAAPGLSSDLSASS